MQISINRANKIRNALEHLEIGIEPTINVLTNDGDLDQKVTAAQAKFMATLSERYQQYRHISELRTLIHDANNANGATKIIAEIAMLENMIKDLSRISETLSYQHTIKTPAEVEAIHHYNERQEMAGNPAMPQRATVTIIDDAIKQQIRDRLQDLKLESQTLQEDRNRLNHSGTVTLPQAMVEFCQKHGLLR